jgi:Skp family chaperone for outer membrane proteins
MKKILFLTLFTFGTVIAVQAQSDTENDAQRVKAEKMKELYIKYKDKKIYLEKGSKEYTAYYNKLRALELQKNDSPSEREASWRHQSFQQKLKQEVDVSIYTQQDIFYKWIEENINSTDFRNTEEAKEEWQRLHTASKKSIESNNDYYDYMMELAVSVENFPELMTDVSTTIIFEKYNLEKK